MPAVTTFKLHEQISIPCHVSLLTACCPLHYKVARQRLPIRYEQSRTLRLAGQVDKKHFCLCGTAVLPALYRDK
jgi:hypothetical protein